jgi:hypothetical protein
MITTIQITTDNYNGQTAVITFTPDNGDPVVNLGSQVLPYDYNAEYVYGTYSLYFPLFDTTCTLVIVNQTQTPTPTPTVTPNQTQTPTPSITPTLTPTPTQSNLYYVYRFCNTNPPQYMVQTQPGYTIIPNKVFRYGVDYGFPIGILYFCSEFLYVTSTLPTFPPGTNVTNYTGNFFTIINPGAPTSPFNNCSDCLAYVEPPPPQQGGHLVGPYGTRNQACVAGNAAGGQLGFTTLTNGITIGSQVYNNPILGSPTLVTTPGWYALAPSFLAFYNAFRIDNTGTIVELGGLCF